MISIVIPAYNESTGIESTITTAVTAFREAGVPSFEIIVADDASTDDTARLAERAGARIVFSGKRNIGATRNVGAAAAGGEWILFLDADTLVPVQTVKAMLEAMQDGVIGGGAPVAWSEPADRVADFFLWVWNTYERLTRSPAGSFFFVRRDAFEAVGGFNERLFASEELDLRKRLKRLGRLVIVTHPVRTSPRKIKQFKKSEMARIMLRMCLQPRKSLTKREYLPYWYERRS